MTGTAIKTAYIGIGSNLGDKLNNCLETIDLIDSIDTCNVKNRSHFYRTEPVGVVSQDWYVNGVIRIETGLTPYDLLRFLLTVEADMGRVRRQKWESRIIDLDILLYGDEVIREKDLTIPHPLMHVRRFVLIPMTQLRPGLIHPILGKSMSELLDDLPGEEQGVVLLKSEDLGG